MNRYIIKTLFIFVSISIFLNFSSYSRSDEGESSSPSPGNIGIQIVNQDGHIIVTSVTQGSPAEREGIRKGDMILEVDDVPVSGLSVQDILKKLEGPVGNSVKIDLKQAETDNDRTIDIKRDIIKEKSTNTDNSIPPVLPGGTSPSNVTLYFNPVSSRIEMGSPIILQIISKNPKGILADEVGFWIKYNPRVITPIETGTSAVLDMNKNLFSGWTVLQYYSHASTGDIYIHLKTDLAEVPLTGSVCKLKFIPAGNGFMTQIQFRFSQTGSEPNTFMYYKKHDILGSELDPRDGTLSASIQITPKTDNP